MFRIFMIMIYLIACGVCSSKTNSKSKAKSNSKSKSRVKQNNVGTSQVMSTFSTILIDGENKYMKTEHQEMYGDHSSEEPVKFRTFRQAYEKNNDEPGIFFRAADTNIEEEKSAFGDEPDVQIIDNDDVKIYY
jgi:hypothetical protein